MTTTDLILPETLRADVVYAPGGVDGILERIEREVRTTPTDISTRPGRAAVAALAYRVARSKTALDELGKNLVADWKSRAALVDEDRRRVRERLDGLRDEVRRPLTEWEDAERARVVGHEQFLSWLEEFAKFDAVEPSAELLAQRIVKLSEIPPREWHEFAKRAAETTAQVLASLRASHDAAVRREDERAELARLRREEEDRRKRDYEEELRRVAAEEARERAEAEAREAARAQAAREAAERARVDRERVAAEEARQKAERQAEWEKRNAQTIAENAERARIAAAEKAKQDAAAAVEAERARVAQEKKQEEAAKVKREADKKHREMVHKEIFLHLNRAGFDEGDINTLIELMIRGIPHVQIIY